MIISCSDTIKRKLLKDLNLGLFIALSAPGLVAVCTFRVPPFTMTFCLSGWTPVRAKSWALNTIGGSSVFSSTASNFSLPHFTFTGRGKYIGCVPHGEKTIPPCKNTTTRQSSSLAVTQQKSVEVNVYACQLPLTRNYTTRSMLSNIIFKFVLCFSIQ